MLGSRRGERRKEEVIGSENFEGGRGVNDKCRGYILVASVYTIGLWKAHENNGSPFPKYRPIK
jgi:hypothetical protein